MKRVLRISALLATMMTAFFIGYVFGTIDPLRGIMKPVYDATVVRPESARIEAEKARLASQRRADSEITNLYEQIRALTAERDALFFRALTADRLDSNHRSP